VSRTTEDKGAAFRALHVGEPFVIPNPWDAGSARVLAALGFGALATTSSGFAFTLGRLDGGATLDEVVAQLDDLFFEDWYFATGEKVELQETLESSLPAQAEASRAAPRTQVPQVIPTGPTDDALVSILFIMHFCNVATSRLWIATPYFVPDTAVVRALELAALRGVDVRILLPKTSDNRLVHWVSLHYAEFLQARGAKVKLVGFDSSPMLLDEVKAGSIDSLVIQDPFKMGETAVIEAVKAMRGESTPKRLFLPPRLIDAENINDPAIQVQLHGRALPSQD